MKGCDPLENKPAETVKVLEKAITILDTVKDSSEPLGVNEISRQCGVNLTTTFRILKTLKSRGWLYQNVDDKYIIGQKVSYVTEKNNFYIALKEIAYYTMTRLSSMVSQAMNLIVRENDKCFILQQSRTEKIVDYVPPIVTILPVYASAGGKVLLSELPKVILDAILDRLDFKPFTRYTIIRRSEFLDELEKCRQLGYALDARESQEEGFCIAAPVRGKDGEVIAALSFSGIIGGIRDSEITYYEQLLKKAAIEISDNLFKLESEKTE